MSAEALGTAAALLLLAAGAVQDVQRGRISVMLNRLLLAAIALALLALPFRGEALAITLARVAVAAAAFLLFLFYVLGGADAKFLMLTALALPFRDPLAPVIFLLLAVVLWAVIPTRTGLRMLDPRVLAPLALLMLVDIRVALLALALYLALIRRAESTVREKFPFLHALLAAAVLHLTAQRPGFPSFL